MHKSLCIALASFVEVNTHDVLLRGEDDIKIEIYRYTIARSINSNIFRNTNTPALLTHLFKNNIKTT